MVTEYNKKDQREKVKGRRVRVKGWCISKRLPSAVEVPLTSNKKTTSCLKILLEIQHEPNVLHLELFLFLHQ